MNVELINLCNELLRGERAAVATYTQAINRIDSEDVKESLQLIQAEHLDVVSRFELLIRGLESTPDTRMGLWGGFAKAVEGTATLFGVRASLKALIFGEEHGFHEYTAASNEQCLDTATKVLLELCLERQKSHISKLNDLLDAV